MKLHKPGTNYAHFSCSIQQSSFLSAKFLTSAPHGLPRMCNVHMPTGTAWREASCTCVVLVMGDIICVDETVP